MASAGVALPDLSPAQSAELKGLVATRLSGVPLAHLTGRQDFMGLDYMLHKGTYIPRKDTELLAKTALACINENLAGSPEVKVIDVCTGIGTVALAIAHFCRKARVFGSDIYSPAIEAAWINAEECSLKNQADIIVSAPPYISSGKVKNMAPEIAQHEPELAFDAGPFGVSVFMSLISTALEYLTLDGHLIIECGQGQGAFIGKRLATNGHYGDVAEVLDAHGHVRVLSARRIS
jgi:release factor glutamine methyltransferase